MRAKQMFRLYWKRVGVVGVAAAGLGLHQHQWEHKDVDKVGRESILDKNIVNLAPSAGQRVNEMVERWRVGPWSITEPLCRQPPALRALRWR